MKKHQIITCLFFGFWLILYANESAGQTLYIDSIPKDGILLNKGWKFHAGDDKNWSLLSFNDSSWSEIDPTKPVQDLPQVRSAQIGWLRLHIHAGKALRGKMIALAVNQIGASEIYLNGNLIQKYGKVSSNFNEEKTYNPYGQPVNVLLGDADDHLLSIRFSFNKRNLYSNFRSDFFNLQLSLPSTAQENFIDHKIKYDIYRSVVWGIFIILSILQLSIYFVDRSRKINLYLSLFTFFQSCTFSNSILSPFLHSSTSIFYWLILFFIAAHITFAFFLLIVYNLFNQPKNRWFKFLVALCLLTIPIEFGRERILIYNILIGIGVLVYFENLRISIIAFRKKYPGSTLFLIGQSVAFVFFTLSQYFTGQPFNYLDIENVIAFVTPAIIISIHLAREFAHNNISLRQQLKEIELLSEKTLAQEQEKQQILATQNETLEKQVQERTFALKQSLDNLKSTQSQLIQSEKMASLGELTAGIAHEIQNPLNFVNNFSEVNNELLVEMKDEIDKGNIDDVKTIANDVIENGQKILHHGKRADAIVKGMLQHSRSSTGVKEPTNINALADEYLRLSYHGLRAKDKSFNATMKTDFDAAVGKVNIIPQDIGRVVLNLLTNAFYAVDEKKKSGVESYEPTVSISTKKTDGKVEIKVSDNGNGIPQKVIDKIFQPFFTTKPTGSGTGLGLSLSYDIVKAHGGELKVETKEGEGTAFIIQLPNL